ncbi:MAG: phosphatase PAP2 family protein [Solirubrobacterales bacterium]
MKPRAGWKTLDAIELPFLEWVERVRLGGMIERATGLITVAGEHGGVWYVIGGTAALVDKPQRSSWLRATFTVALVYLLNTLLKLAAGRRRPPVAARGTPTALSFPSSHAVTSFAAARLFSALAPKLKLPLYFTAVNVTGSRLHFCVHYPSDLIAGAAIGDVLARAARARCC